jgi:sulfocyanin
MPRRLLYPLALIACVELVALGAATRSMAHRPARGSSSATRGAPIKVNQFMSYTAETKTVTLKLFAAFNSVQGGFNFNGGSQGKSTITVPVGWTVNADVVNKDAVPHSAIIIADTRPTVPSAPETPAISRAYTAHLTDGLQPNGGEDTMNFTAAPTGNYLIACGVPGHAPSGMYIRFVVSATATVPSYTM